MSAGERPLVALRGADGSLAALLAEWLPAAGFVPQAELPGADAVLAVWPGCGELPLHGAQVVLLVPVGAEVPAGVQRRVAEVVPLPDSRDVRSLFEWSKLLVSVLRTAAAARRFVPNCSPMPLPHLDAQELRARAPTLVAVGVSTGGPVALQTFFGSLCGSTLPPIAIVQHIPPTFLEVLVERLRQQTGYRLQVATAGEVLRAGTAYFAPADAHLEIGYEGGQLVARHSAAPARRGHRPAAEVLFESCAELPLRGVGVLLTGMGQDGAQALLRLRQLGWATVGQNEATCAIYGMPRAARQLGAIERELPLADIGPFLTMLCRPRPPSRRD